MPSIDAGRGRCERAEVRTNAAESALVGLSPQVAGSGRRSHATKPGLCALRRRVPCCGAAKEQGVIVNNNGNYNEGNGNDCGRLLRATSGAVGIIREKPRIAADAAQHQRRTRGEKQWAKQWEQQSRTLRRPQRRQGAHPMPQRAVVNRCRSLLIAPVSLLRRCRRRGALGLGRRPLLALRGRHRLELGVDGIGVELDRLA